MLALASSSASSGVGLMGGHGDWVGMEWATTTAWPLWAGEQTRAVCGAPSPRGETRSERRATSAGGSRIAIASTRGRLLAGLDACTRWLLETSSLSTFGEKAGAAELCVASACVLGVFSAPDCLIVECSAVPFLSDFVARSRRSDRALFTPLFCPRFGSSSPSSTLLHSLGQNRTVAHPAMSRPRSSAWSIALVACAASLVRLATAHGDHAEIDSNPSATYSELHMAQEVSVLRLRSSQRGRTADPTPSPRP